MSEPVAEECFAVCDELFLLDQLETPLQSDRGDFI